MLPGPVKHLRQGSPVGFFHRERETYPDMPSGYFDAAITASFNAFRAQALLTRSPDLLAVLPAQEVQGRLTSAWRSPAVSIYRSWLQYLAREKAALRLTPKPVTSTMAALTTEPAQPVEIGADDDYSNRRSRPAGGLAKGR